MSNEYPVDVRRTARRLWLSGRYTDEMIAAQLKIPRADTVRDWRHEEGWGGLARDITGVIDDEVKARVRTERGAFATKYDQLGQVFEARVVRFLNDPTLRPRDLKALANTAAVAQKIRDKAIGGTTSEEAAAEYDLTIAGTFARAHKRRADAERVEPLGRCRTSTGAIQADESRPAEPTENGNTATRGPDTLSVAPA